MKAIIIVALVAAAFATNFAQFEAIEKSELGKTLFDTIAVQLNSGEPLDHLFDMLYTIEDRYIADQKEDDANNKAFQARCDDDLAGLSTEIANAEKKNTELQVVLDDLNAQRNQKNAQRTAKLMEKKELQKVMDEATNQRSEEANGFEEKREEFEFVSSVLAEARRLFTDNFNAPSFLQAGKAEIVHVSPQIMAQVTQHFTEGAHKASKMNHVKSFARAVKLLAQLTARTQSTQDNELVGRIIKLIDDLQNQLNQSFDLERKAEDDRLNAFTQYMGLLQKDMNKYNAELANLDAAIASLSDRIESTTNSQIDVQQRLADKQTQYNDRRAECEEAAYDYQLRRAARDADRQTVSDLIGILNTNMRELREYIALRLAAGDSLD